MAPEPAPLSRTAKYKKITKPLLERKRRARINRCLDELKDLMVGALEIDDDNLSKLEKADILELTVNHLTKLHSPRDPALDAQRFQAGFGQCAAEACRFIMAVPDLDAAVGRSLVGHLTTLLSSRPPSPTQQLQEERQSPLPAFRPVPVDGKDALLQKIRRHIMERRAPDDDSLDLRTVRSPSPPTPPPAPLSPPPLASDYNNLPPKKKRKLLEYQEYRRREEARRASSSPGEDGSAWRPW